MWWGVADPVPPKEENRVAGDGKADRPVGPGVHGDVIVYETGAQRSNLDLRYDLLPPSGLARAAATMARGAERYGEGNWQKGIPVRDCLNHALAHIFKYLEGDQSEDHLAHAACNLLMSCDLEGKQ
jgi:hypothetical protein